MIETVGGRKDCSFEALLGIYIYGPVSRVPTPPHGMGGGYDAPVVV